MAAESFPSPVPGHPVAAILESSSRQDGCVRAHLLADVDFRLLRSSCLVSATIFGPRAPQSQVSVSLPSSVAPGVSSLRDRGS
ncbi:hypothetical protein FKM82_000735 [Ascaphus truei]